MCSYRLFIQVNIYVHCVIFAGYLPPALFFFFFFFTQDATTQMITLKPQCGLPLTQDPVKA